METCAFVEPKSRVLRIHRQADGRGTSLGRSAGEAVEKTRTDTSCLMVWRDRDRQLRQRAALRVSRQDVGLNSTPCRAKTPTVVPRDHACVSRTTPLR